MIDKSRLIVLLLVLVGGMSCGTDQQLPKEKVEVMAKEVKLVEETPAIVFDSTYSDDYLMGKTNPNKHADFTKIAAPFASNNSMYLRKDAYEAFKKMHAAAKKDGVNLQIISAMRPFGHQKRIWEAKWTGARRVEGKDLSKSIASPAERALKILEYSSMPGTSRHHWGTDIDINDLNNEYFAQGKGKKVYDWLDKNAASFGYAQPYSPKGEARPYGYEEEKWHWSYLPIAKKLTDQYRLRLGDHKIKGFKGAETAVEIEVVKKYVLGINTTCL